jgi:outer membrane receptor for ferrienterochelin and colicin
MENKNNQIPQKLRMASFAILATLFMPAFCFSQITKDTTYLNEVVVTASKTLQNKGNVTQKIDVISFRELKGIISSNRNVAEAIQYLPGNAVSVLSRNDANWGTYGGVGPKYSTYMLQGLPIDALLILWVLNSMPLTVLRFSVALLPCSIQITCHRILQATSARFQVQLT